MTFYRQRRLRPASPVQVLWIGFGYVAVGILGAMSIVPCGPGSDRVFYLFLLAYSLVLVALCSRLPRLLAIVLAIVFLGGVIVETKAKRDFQHNVMQKIRERSAEGGQKE